MEFSTPSLYALIKNDMLKPGDSFVLNESQVSPQIARLRQQGIDCRVETRKRFLFDPTTGESIKVIEIVRSE